MAPDVSVVLDFVFEFVGDRCSVVYRTARRGEEGHGGVANHREVASMEVTVIMAIEVPLGEEEGHEDVVNHQ